MGPLGHRQRLPVAEGAQPELEHELGLALELRDAAHHVFAQALGYGVGGNVGMEAVFVLVVPEVLYRRYFVFCHSRSLLI